MKNHAGEELRTSTAGSDPFNLASANSRLVHRSKRYTYSITSSAKATTADEIGVDRLQHQGDLCDYLPPARGAL